MPHVQFLVPDLGYTAAARQVSLVAPALVGPGWTTEVFSLAGDGPFTSTLHAGGVAALSSSARYPFRWLGLGWLLPRPGRGLVHVFGMPMLRRLWLATVRGHRPPVILSLTGREQFGRFDWRCLRIVGRVLVHHSHAADAFVRQGVPSRKITVIPPACASAFQPDEPTGRVKDGTREGPLIVTAGSMPDRHRLLVAVWAFEFLRYPYADAHLLVVGDGPGRAALEATARGLAPEGSRIRFVGYRPTLTDILHQADVVMVPHPTGGVNFVLEAMAAGKAVVAADTPDLRTVITHDETGLLYPTHDAAAAASAVRKLWLDPDRRRAFGEAARARVRERHNLGTVVRSLKTVYDEEFTTTRSGLWTE